MKWLRMEEMDSFEICRVCGKEIVEGTVCWYDYELGNMHLECKEEMIE